MVTRTAGTTLSLLVAALAVSSCSSTSTASVSVSVRGDVQLPVDSRIISARVVPGATLVSLLRARRVANGEVAALVAQASAVFDLRKVRADQPYRIAQTFDGALRWFEYEIDGDRRLQVKRSDGEASGGFVAEVVAIDKAARVAAVRGVIDDAATSLVAAMDRAGETIHLSLELAEIFSSDVDFNTELRPDDRFELLVEKLYRVGEAPREQEEDAFAGYGPILAAQLDNDGRRLRAVRFTPDGGSPRYFDSEGRSLRRFFLRSPLQFQPIVTSRFSRRRLHPILHDYRPHYGVDYRAQAGAAVIAVAGGVVVFAGPNGGSGRMVHLRHANGFQSQYLHLSSIAVRRGARVQQGQLIGRVGSTGLATAPHLDYRLKKHGVFINPETAHRKMPPGEPIPPDQLARFLEIRDRAFADLSSTSVVHTSEF